MRAPDPPVESPDDLLATAYHQLGFEDGKLLPATRNVTPDLQQNWVETGDWQALAAQVGAEKLFFVDNDPVLIFAKSENDQSTALREVYERVWCMSRPQLLFLASPGELSVFDLTKPPPKPNELLDSHDRLVERATSLAEIQSKLFAFNRERVESGAVFGDERFRSSDNRADRALIRDLKTVRAQLTTIPPLAGNKKPELKHLHSLIGRAIFVRYLEDREILTPVYFERIAALHPEWMSLLESPVPFAPLEPRLDALRFPRVLQDKDFTYALFAQLVEDFNGDTFPVETEELSCIQQSHLDRLRGFLTGAISDQDSLFFFAYRFDVVPIELISTIYEEFYNEETGLDRNQGSHYTPSALVDFILGNTLTLEVLATQPRVLDPACGSGIFLVESFRRIVRHLWSEQPGRRVSRPQLRRILRDQIAGIDINEEAVRVAAFSLYLAYLHYQEPREINESRMLPHVKWISAEVRQERGNNKPDSEFFNVLIHANTFEVLNGSLGAAVLQRFGPESADVVVGNPPWGHPKKSDSAGVAALKVVLNWCNSANGRPVGDKELSQAFIHATLAFLREGGRAGLLVSSGVFFKHHSNSRRFRKVWLTSAKLRHVVNFAHVRQIYFSGPNRKSRGISPFTSIVFEKSASASREDSQFQYWSAKRTAVIENTRSIVLNRGDMHWLSQRACLEKENLWKIYWWGGHRDAALIHCLESFPRLKDLAKGAPGVSVIARRGFEEAGKNGEAGWLSNYKELPSKALQRYGKLDLHSLIAVPPFVARRSREDIYSGRRLLVGRGIRESGVITARFETEPFCFRHSIYGVRLNGFEQWQEAVITAIFWSSVARYFYFLTSSSWGFWHFELHLNEVEEMPVTFPQTPELQERIVNIVRELESVQVPSGEHVLEPIVSDRIAELEVLLDDAVFDLFELNISERDLIRDMCGLGFDLFYKHRKSAALKRVIQPRDKIASLQDLPSEEVGLATYLRTFLEIWNKELPPGSELISQILTPRSNAPLLAVSFVTHYQKNSLASHSEESQRTWDALLARLQANSLLQIDNSRIFIDTFFRYVGDREILFIKRNERRFWTKTAAREDAESTFVHLMNLESDSRVKSGE